MPLSKAKTGSFVTAEQRLLVRGDTWRMSTFHGQNRPKGASLPSMMLTVWRSSDYVRLTIMFVPVLPSMF